MPQTIETYSNMSVPVTYNYPDEQFWDEYEGLWNDSLHKPVFKSPHYVKYLANRFKDTFAMYRYVSSDTLKGVVFFRKEGNEYHLLTDVKADHNFFVIHKSCSAEEIEEFFAGLLKVIKKEKWSLLLSVQPMWTSYMLSFVRNLDKSGLFWNVTKHTVCPVLEEETAKILYDKLNASRELRYRVSRIKSQLNGEFEILTGEEDLDEWVHKFCLLHRKRWEGTNSPSRYRNEEEERFLKNCLLSWIEDNVLVRFAVKVGGERIAFVICLVQQNSLIHHSTAYDDDFYKYSPGKALILIIAEWMKNKGLNVLDFGEGAESYKYAYTNKEMELSEFAIAAFSNVSFILRVKLKQIVREQISDNPKLKKFFKEKLKPLTQRAKVTSS